MSFPSDSMEYLAWLVACIRRRLPAPIFVLFSYLRFLVHDHIVIILLYGAWLSFGATALQGGLLDD